MQEVEAYIATLPEPRRSVIQHYHELIRQAAPELEPKLWGKMIGYGQYHYKYATGREGDYFKLGLANRAQYISLYCLAMNEDGTAYLAGTYAEHLPGTTIGNSCINIKKPELLDDKVLTQLFKDTARLLPDVYDATA